jgi:hypothetical protein
MKKLANVKMVMEGVALLCLLGVLATSCIVIAHKVAGSRRVLAGQGWMDPKQAVPTVPTEILPLEQAADALTHPFQSDDRSLGLLASELRVVAVGSAYPIPYDAETCPFTGIPQPSMNQLDRDGDGLTDDWELKYGLDKYNANDAGQDADGDGFSNLEEFRAGFDPTDAASHAPYALKLRFLGRKDIPFPMVFKGHSQLPDGRRIFQLNAKSTGKTHFCSLGESVEGVVVQRYVEGYGGAEEQLVVERGGLEIILPRGQIVADPESQAELINILDRTNEIVTMGALLSLRNDEYTVLGVYSDRVVIKRLATGDVFDVVGLADDEQ